MTDDPADMLDTATTDPGTLVGRIDHDETIDLLQELVRIRSPYFEEEAITEFVYDWLDSRGHDPEYHPVSEPDITGFEGNNVLARLEGSDPGAPTLLLNAHMDTVEIVEAWEEDPLSGRIEDGKLYGQGACDMKGGLAGIMVAFDALATADVDLAGDLLFSAVVDEEGPYGLGANQLVRDGITDECDAAIVTEPGPILAQTTIENPALLLGARGRFLYDITVTGEAAHGSQPQKGTNAVVDAGRLADALAAMDVGTHEKLGDGSVCPIEIEGGGETLSVPESCRLLADRHVVIGETEDVVRADAERVVADLDLDSDVQIDFRDAPAPDVRYGPYVTDADDPLVNALSSGVETVTDDEPAIGYFSSVGDFNYFGHRAGLPTVIVGPDGENIHGAGEFVHTDDVVAVARIVTAGCVSLLG
ncbi:M20/M25/M40 family metallo-hydrolase [Halococcus dombrowskii]|uniref:M20 family metallopeptidase n=1 Tax=Halococcus dombrowskii TaxID=179637 RepID=A0AAV3SCX4_HALDO|nr:M20/M25/M40 family metallo-hydrolase [Halococcus dombrowskii]UOO95039.1 M20/M25/M40 family metallo-hydrolase [Halococcus dombrowskii]